MGECGFAPIRYLFLANAAEVLALNKRNMFYDPLEVLVRPNHAPRGIQLSGPRGLTSATSEEELWEDPLCIAF